MKTFKIKKGRWVIGNLYDKLVASKFDQFINWHREPNPVRRTYRAFPLHVYNHQFKSSR